jgi:hypothetical protein
MGRWLSEDVSGRIAEAMFRNFSDSEAEKYLRKKEFERYIPQFTGWDEKDITAFMDYQKAIWLGGKIPILRESIACLNPTFVSSVGSIVVSSRNLFVYSRAGTKENGYRLQLHNGPQDSVFPNASAVTRQFTPYDLRMFPEFHSLFPQLPVTIGDTELVNRRFKHLAGFNRVQERIPNTKYWPSRETGKIDDELLKEYLQSDMFVDGMPTEEFELTLAFHGLFAISHPETWDSSHEEQLRNMISLCKIPMDYREVDELLDMLAEYIQEKDLNARVVERKVIKSKQALRNYVDENEEKGLEGTVVVQYAEDKEGTPSLDFAKSIKIKAYETIDTVLLGVYVGKKEDGLVAENMKGALLGLYDAEHDCYLPVCKVNLDPQGVQIKEDHQRERLIRLREDLEEILEEKEEADSLVRLYDVYMMELQLKLERCLGDEVDSEEISQLFDELPRGQDFVSLLGMYNRNKQKYDEGELGTKKSSTKKDKWVYKYKDVLSSVAGLKEQDEKKYREVTKYLKKASEIKNTSKKLVKPQFVLDTTEPIIMETQVFDIKWSLNPYPAGFHSWFCDSFRFSNCFAERIRHDKASTTDYQTVYVIARENTIRRKKK